MKKNATNMIRPVLTGVLLTLTGVCSGQRIPMKNVVGPVERMQRRTIERQLTSELALMKITMRLNAAQIDALKAAAQPAINTEAHRLAHPQAGNHGGAGNEVPSPVMEAVLKKAAQRVGAFRVNAYVNDRLERKKFHQQTGIDGFLVALDRSLVLSEGQVAQFNELLHSHWKEPWTSLGMTAGPSGLLTLRGPVKSLPKKQLRAVLRPSQWSALMGPDTTPFRTLMVRTEQVSLEKQRKQFVDRQQGHGENVGKLKLEEITQLCMLEPRQYSRLRDAMTSAVDLVVERQTEAFVKMKSVGPANTDKLSMTYITTHVSEQIDDIQAWRRAVTGTLTRPQMVTWRTRQDVRKEMQTKAAASVVVARLSQQFGFTRKQQLALLSLLLDSRSNTTEQEDMQAVLLSIPNESLSEIFQADQWLRLRSALDARREQLGFDA